MIKHIKARMENALTVRNLAAAQYDDGERDLNNRLIAIVGELRTRFAATKYAVADITYRIETFKTDGQDIVGVRLTIHRLQQMQNEYYATSLRTTKEIDEVFAKEGMRNWSMENFEDNSRVTTIVYL